MALFSQMLASTCLCPRPQTIVYHHWLGIPRLSSSRFSPYVGLKRMGISVSTKSIKLVTKRSRSMVVRASLFGVGAPEALVIGVVALLVFGPKGLAEVARNLGKTLRAFQPTIRELQEVSREFKGTLEREIGLDDFSSPDTSSTYRPRPTSAPPKTGGPDDLVDPNGAMPPKQAYTSEEYLKITEEQLKAAASQQSEPAPPAKENKAGANTEPES